MVYLQNMTSPMLGATSPNPFSTLIQPQLKYFKVLLLTSVFNIGSFEDAVESHLRITGNPPPPPKVAKKRKKQKSVLKESEDEDDQCS
jgi:hypothetical protein